MGNMQERRKIDKFSVRDIEYIYTFDYSDYYPFDMFPPFNNKKTSRCLEGRLAQTEHFHCPLVELWHYTT